MLKDTAVTWEEFEEIKTDDDKLNVYLKDITSKAIVNSEENLNLAKAVIADNQKTIIFIEANLWRVVTIAKRLIDNGSKEYIMDLIEDGNRGLTAFATELKEKDLEDLENNTNQAILFELNNNIIRIID